MARSKFGSIFSELSGSIGGITFQNSLAGSIIRNKPTRKGKTSQFTDTNHKYFSTLNIAWQALTDAQRQIWYQFSKFAPVPQVHNPSLFISGQEQFTRINYYLLAYGKTLISNPVFSNISPLPVTPFYNSAGLNLYVTFDRSIDHTTEFVILKASATLTPVITAIKSKLKLLIFATVSNATQNLYQPYYDRFGTPTYKGDRIGFSVSIMNIATGKMLPWINNISIV